MLRIRMFIIFRKILIVALIGFYVGTFSLLVKETFLHEELMKTNYDCTLGDPTYQEMKDFLVRDKTDLRVILTIPIVDINIYDCTNFSRGVRANAIKEGIRCAYVRIWFSDNDEKRHAVVAFNTTDKGIIFVEPQSDKEMKVAVGGKYWSNIINSYRIYWPNLNNKK